MQRYIHRCSKWSQHVTTVKRMYLCNVYHLLISLQCCKLRHWLGVLHRPWHLESASHYALPINPPRIHWYVIHGEVWRIFSSRPCFNHRTLEFGVPYFQTYPHFWFILIHFWFIRIHLSTWVVSYINFIHIISLQLDNVLYVRRKGLLILTRQYGEVVPFQTQLAGKNSSSPTGDMEVTHEIVSSYLSWVVLEMDRPADF